MTGVTSKWDVECSATGPKAAGTKLEKRARLGQGAAAGMAVDLTSAAPSRLCHPFKPWSAA